MASSKPSTYTAFQGFALISRGAPGSVALAVKHAHEAEPAQTVLVFDDSTGQQIDLDLRGSDEEVRVRYSPCPASGNGPAEPRGRGRPKLGVTAREVTLLPRQWEWLNAQPGGASVTLRRLVEEARRREQENGRSARDAAFAFMAAMAGNLPGFEEASRALFRGNRERFEALVARWPADVAAHALRLAFGA
jgi:hypothetical protein